MSPLSRRPAQIKLLAVVSCALLAAPPLASAQHANHPATAPHYSAPPISHAPPISRPTTIRAPLFRAPVFRAPIYEPRFTASPIVGRFGTAIVHIPRRPIRPFPPVLFLYGFPFFTGPWGFNSCCNDFWLGTFDYTTVYASGTANYLPPEYQPPAYDYGLEAPSLPQLYLNDGSILNVTDYWLVDDQLHFTMIEDDGGQTQEHVIPYELLDVQKTRDVDARRGFRFMLRDEPVEQYLRDHPEGPPPPSPAPQ